MLNLSMKEQKEIVGGYYCVKVYYRPTGALINKEYYNTYAQAKAAADSYDKNTCSVVIVEIN